MVKSVVVTLSVTIPDTALSQTCNVIIGAATYAGKVTGIITHEEAAAVPATTTVSISGPGLKTP